MAPICLKLLVLWKHILTSAKLKQQRFKVTMEWFGILSGLLLAIMVDYGRLRYQIVDLHAGKDGLTLKPFQNCVCCYEMILIHWFDWIGSKYVANGRFSQTLATLSDLPYAVRLGHLQRMSSCKVPVTLFEGWPVRRRIH